MSITFNSVTLTYGHFTDAGLPARSKVTDYPGCDGVDVLPMGLGARECTVSMIATSNSPSRGTLEGLMDGEEHTLTTDIGSFGHCECVNVRVVKVWRNCVGGSIDVEYELTFRQNEPD